MAPRPGCAQQRVLAWHSSAPPLLLPLIPPPSSYHSRSSVSHFKPLFGNVLYHIWVNILRRRPLRSPCSRKADGGVTDPQQPFLLPASLRPLSVHVRDDMRKSEMVEPLWLHGVMVPPSISAAHCWSSKLPNWKKLE